MSSCVGAKGQLVCEARGRMPGGVVVVGGAGEAAEVAPLASVELLHFAPETAQLTAKVGDPASQSRGGPGCGVG